jgi:putative spermidine/putrescine transport system substrate-binding protein
VQLMRTGQYDTVSASGDATLRLIAAGDVEPVNTNLISNYPDIFDSLKMQPWNSVRGVPYGIPHGRGANLLMWRTDHVKPAPDSWSAVFDQAASQKGKVTAYDSPIYIADAALYLMATKPELGIKNPYALDAKQLAASVDLLKAQKANVGDRLVRHVDGRREFEAQDLCLQVHRPHRLAQDQRRHRRVLR